MLQLTVKPAFSLMLNLVILNTDHMLQVHDNTRHNAEPNWTSVGLKIAVKSQHIYSVQKQSSSIRYRYERNTVKFEMGFGGFS